MRFWILNVVGSSDWAEPVVKTPYFRRKRCPHQKQQSLKVIEMIRPLRVSWCGAAVLADLSSAHATVITTERVRQAVTQAQFTGFRFLEIECVPHLPAKYQAFAPNEVQGKVWELGADSWIPFSQDSGVQVRTLCPVCLVRENVHVHSGPVQIDLAAWKGEDCFFVAADELLCVTDRFRELAHSQGITGLEFLELSAPFRSSLEVVMSELGKHLQTAQVVGEEEASPDTRTADADQLSADTYGGAELRALQDLVADLEGLGAEIGFAEAPDGSQKIVELDLSISDVADDDLRIIRRLPDLKALMLSGTGITDAALTMLKYARNLEKLDVSRTHISSKAGKCLKLCKNLRYLDVAHTKVDDSGIHDFTKNEVLEVLVLAFTEVTDKGLALLVGCPELTHLYLQGAKVTDAGVGLLGRITKLKYVNLIGTRVTKHGVMALQDSAPTLEIGY